MRFTVIVVLFFIEFCKSNDLECGRTEMELAEFYCSNFNGTVPSDCFSAKNSTDESQVIQLKVGDCDNDQVKQIVEMLPNLRSLDISHSEIVSLDKFDIKHEHLMKVNASHNQLTEVSTKLFSKMPQVIEIDFSYNKLNRINELPTKLVKVNLSHNNLSSIHRDDFANLIDLEDIDLSYNSITKLDLFYIFPMNKKLKTLRLEKNAIKEFDYRFTPLLRRGVSVHISWKNITKFLLWNYEADKIRVIRNSDKEGILKTDNGNVELHCNETSFENIVDFRADSNHIKNPTEMIHCLTASLKFLELAGHFDEQFNTTLLEKFTNLNNLSLKGTQILKFDMNVVKNYKNLNIINLPGNNLTKIDNFNTLNDLKCPISLNVSNNQLKNVSETFNNLTANIVNLDLSENFVGKLNATTFQQFTGMKKLNLRNTSFSMDDFKPLEIFESLVELDISRNNLENLNFTSTSTALKQLQLLNVAHCRVGNITELMKLLGPSLWNLNLAGNVLLKLDAKLFDNIKMGLKVLNLSETHLTDLDDGALEHISKLENLDLSHNEIKKLNFTFALSHLRTFHLDGNDLIEVENLKKSNFPLLRFLNISKNQLKCEYLAKFVPQLMNEWPHLIMLDDPWLQKHEEDCYPKVEATIEHR